MKKITSLLLLTCIVLFASFDKNSLLNHPMISLSDKTLDGKIIDSNYFKGHITIVSFMYIGCLPCMNEISTLNKLKKDYSSGGQLQVLCIARQMRSQMVEFNSSRKSLMSSVRKALSADSIEYDIQPACGDTVSKMQKKTVNDSDMDITMKQECSIIEETYGVHSYPTIFFVDKKGIVRNIHIGGPGTPNDSVFYNKIKKEVDLLLNQ